MFNLGFTELILLGVIALIFIGPNQLPEVARTVGRLLNEWRRATSDFQSTITSNITEDVQGRWNEARLQNSGEPEAGHGPESIPPEHEGHGHEHDYAHEHHIHDESIHAVTDHEVAAVASGEAPAQPDPLPEGAAPVAGKEDKKS